MILKPRRQLSAGALTRPLRVKCPEWRVTQGLTFRVSLRGVVPVSLLSENIAHVHDESVPLVQIPCSLATVAVNGTPTGGRKAKTTSVGLAHFAAASRFAATR